MKRLVNTVMCVCMIGSVGLSTATWASDEAATKEAIKYRKNMMSAIGGHMGAAWQIIEGKVEHKGDLAMHTQALQVLSQDLVRLFPKGSDKGKTDALPVIWEKWADFEKVSKQASEYADKFARAVADGDSAKISQAYREYGKQACKACHKDYRKDKKKK